MKVKRDCSRQPLTRSVFSHQSRRTGRRNRSLGRWTWLLLANATAVGALIGLARPALAWGRMAHRASARLAEARLSPQTRAIIRDLLEPGESLADASTWADENSREIPGSAGWHYVNVPVSAQHYDPRDCRRGGCVVSKIAEFRTVLLDPRASRSRRQSALRFYIHLIQDLHQPMHVADRDDRGGNNLQLRYGRYDNTNLHQVWDSGLLYQGFRNNETELLHKLEELAHQPESGGWLKGRVEDWADESLEVGRRAYLVPGSNQKLRAGDSLSREYERANLPLATERVARSGIRLAAMLNEALKPPTPAVGVPLPSVPAPQRSE